MILESLGVPNNLIELSEKIYIELINEMPRYGDIFMLEDTPIRIEGDFQISDYNFNLIEIYFKFYDYNETSFVGMSYNQKKLTSKGVKYLTQESNFDEIEIAMSFAGDETLTPQTLTKYIVSNQPTIISSISHELKHAYDSYKKPTSKVIDMAEYNTYTESFGQIEPLNKLLFHLYFTHQIEDLVRPTELASLIKTNNVTKKNFLSFLKNTSIFKKLDSARKFNYDNLKKELKNYIPEIKEVVNMSGSEVANGEDELIDQILNLFYINVSNWNMDNLDKFIMISPFDLLFDMGGEKSKFREKYYNKMTRYENDIDKFFNYNEKILNRKSNDMIKKLGKVYDYIDRDKKQQNETVINPDIWYNLKENQRPITNRLTQ